MDEAQDFSPAELTSLMSLCGDSSGVTIAGDTCQTINPGSAFSFQDIIDAFQRLEPKPFFCGGHADKQDDPDVKWDDAEKCCLMSLGFNFRSATPIVQLANSVSELLLQMFPCAADAVEEMSASDQGGKPPLFVYSPDVVDVVSFHVCRRISSLLNTFFWAALKPELALHP